MCRGSTTSSGASVATRRARKQWSPASPASVATGTRAIGERRGEPEPRPGDLASHLLHATVDDAPLEETVVLDMLQVLVLAGLDTTRGQLGYLFKYLADNPTDRRRLVDEPALVPAAVEESLRLHTIIFGDGRKVTTDTEFHGCPLQARATWCTALVASAQPRPCASTSGPVSTSSTARGVPTSGSPAGRTAASAPSRSQGAAGRRRGVAAGHP